ncbi:MAG TPA: ornithine cyclodeaminase family protein [Streptosporangiaceae bacterium]|nr:ornithine cyclodeaminase family protein [Streptosporangiaceae bacterium]
MSRQLLVLSNDAVRAVLSYPLCAEAMRDALIARARGDFYQPLRTVLKVPGPGGLVALMPAYRYGASAEGSGESSPRASTASAGYGLKAINITHDNPGRGLDSHQGIVLLSSSETGEPIAVLNASAVTEVRTAAVSAVATNQLANADADVLTIIGAGVQARSHLRAIASTRALAEIRVVARTAEKAQRFAADMALLAGDAKVTGYASAEEALAGAGIVVTATNSAVPVIQRQWITPGTHINAVGACLPHARELDSATVADAALFCDSKDAVIAEAGDFVIAAMDGAIDRDHLMPELGDVLAGTAAGRSGEREITIFESLGLAAEDLAAAAAAYQVAVERGIGSLVDFG